MDIVDFHGHFFPDEVAPHALKTVADICGGEIVPVLDGTMNGLLEGMGSAGVTTTVTLPVATKPEQVSSINSSLPMRSREIVPFGAINPLSSSWEQEIDFLVEQNICGVKLHPEYQGFYCDDSSYFPFYEKLADSNMIVLFHAGYDPGPFTRDHATPQMLRKVIDSIPDLTVVAGHFGGLMMWDDVETYLMGENLWFDTSAIGGRISYEQFERIVLNHGYERILFGSDTPWESQHDALEFIRRSSLTSEILDAILGTNARKLLQNHE